MCFHYAAYATHHSCMHCLACDCWTYAVVGSIEAAYSILANTSAVQPLLTRKGGGLGLESQWPPKKGKKPVPAGSSSPLCAVLVKPLAKLLGVPCGKGSDNIRVSEYMGGLQYTIADLVTHLCSLDASFHAASSIAQVALSPSPMFFTLYFIVTRLSDRPSCELTIDLLETTLTEIERNLHSVASATAVVVPRLFMGCNGGKKGEKGGGGGGGTGALGGGGSGGGTGAVGTSHGGAGSGDGAGTQQWQQQAQRICAKLCSETVDLHESSICAERGR
ncbi:unnamed protein product [Closterium sp. NIES-54]